MHILRKRGWELPERLVTPEDVFMNRRAFMGAAAGAIAALVTDCTIEVQRDEDLPQGMGS